MKTLVASLAALLAAPALSLAAPAAPQKTPISSRALDGTTWEAKARVKLFVTMTDPLSFTDGTFVSKECIPYGFQDSGYEAEEKDGRLVWRAIQVNEKGETMEWQGVRDGDRMTGSYVYTDATGKKTRQTWTAKRTS